MNVRPEVERLPHRPFTADEVSRMVEAGILGEDDRVELIEGESPISRCATTRSSRPRSMRAMACRNTG